MELTEEDEEVEELDLEKTKKSFWEIITFQSSFKRDSQQYSSILNFLEDSLPRLKKIQIEDIRKALEVRAYQLQ